VELEAAKRERDLALRRAKTERDNALRNLEERRKTGRVSEQAYRVEREALEAAYAKSVAEAEGQYRTRTAQARLSDLERRLARRTAAIQNPREKVEVELKAYTDWLAAYAATAPKEITAAVRERIEDLKAQLRTLPDFSRLREAEVMEGLKSMFMGGRLPAFGLEILRLAESIRNDAQLTTVQKRRLGVNPEAMNLDQLLLPEGLLGRMHRLGVLGDAYAGTALPRLYAYQA
ncbi:hypothetical protein, partial [Thermus sp.]|uniref:hypothetical protein n=1 Tax=Thermus sp. TaxID=275 RepID=UPI002628D0A0